ncbi:Hsp70 family protein [Dactylosporangium sp. CA-139066]|uniref:Hsp70 family protein n=1 Tax=Dactylosporangium sp. CA-139066 TaxID=3239930 RepID=UPI003D8EC608
MVELGIDLGTSATVAFVRRPDGTVEPVLFDGASLLPSAVFADEGGLIVGRDAVHSARTRPERFEGSPKRRIDEPSVLLGDAEVAVESLLGALLWRAAGEAARIAGAPVTAATVCHPAAWGPARRETLQRAAAAAGLNRLRLVPEPVAAAAFHLRRHQAGPADLLVYDLGAGTFDVAVVRFAPGTATPMTVLCSAGLDDTGGQDIDAAIVDLLRTRCGTPEAWARLDNPATIADRAARRQLWDDVRAAKEMLSRSASTTLYVPIADQDQTLSRADVEGVAAPLIQRTVNAVHATLAGSPVPLRPFFAVLLVGGASRMPLVGAMVHHALGVAPTVVDQPELVVAAGSLDPLLYPPPVAAPPATAAVLRPVAAAPVPPAPPGPAPSGITVTAVELIEVSLPEHSGFTLRGQLHAGYGVFEHVFPADAGGRLLMFPEAAQLAQYAAANAGRDPLLATPPWQVRNTGADEARYDLDLLVEHLSGPPEGWLPSYVCRCRDLCAQLALFLDLDGVDDLIGEHTTIDQADDALRRHLLDPTARGARRRLAKVDLAQLLEDWTDLIAIIDAATVTPAWR